ncbi:MAG: FxsA family protein [Candidatus Omnitrophota bacterium]
MFAYLFLLFTIVPAVELMLLIKVGTYIGAFNTVLLIILTGVWGAHLARLQGFLIVRKINESLAQGQMPTEEMLEGFMVFCGGVLLLTPGFITDLLGFLLLIPFTRVLLKFWAKKKITALMRDGQITAYSNHHKRRSQYHDDDYEDAEFH